VELVLFLVLQIHSSSVYIREIEGYTFLAQQALSLTQFLLLGRWIDGNE